MSSSSLSPNLISNKSDPLWKILFNQPSQSVVILDAEGRVLEINEAALQSQVQKFSRNDYVGVFLWDTPFWNHLPEWESIWQQRLAQASKQHDSVITQDMFQGKGGSTLYSDTTTTAIYDSTNGQLSGYLILSIDKTKQHVIDNQKQKNESRVSENITEIKQTEVRHKEEYKSIFNALPDTCFRIKNDGTILDYNAENESDLYADSIDFVGKRMQDVLPKDIGLLFQLKIDEFVQTKTTVIFKYEWVLHDQKVYFEAHLDSVSIDDQLICIIRNITDEFKSQESLAASEQLFRTVFEQAAVGVALLSANQAKFIRINQRLCDILGYSVEEMSDGKSFEDIIHPGDLASSMAYRDEMFRGEQRGRTIEKRYIHKDGHVVWVDQTSSATWNINEQPQTFIIVVQDISERKEAEKKLKLSSRVFSNTHEGIMITDAHKIIVDVNPAFEKITGYSLEDVVGKTPRILSSSKQSPNFYIQMWSEIDEHGFWQGEVWNRTKQGELYAELLNISSLMNEADEVTHYIGVFSDITSSKQQQDKLNLIAHYDELTKLPNRALFIDRFHQSMVHSKSTGHQLAVCFLDLDNFKPVNDNYGHEVGDRLLVEVADRIVESIRPGDTVSRQGGDEFAILLNDIESDSQHENIISRIHKAIARPFLINDVQHSITASTGVTLYPQDNGDIDTLLRHADRAMYQAKLLGKNRSQLHSLDIDLRIISKNLQLDEIEQALGRQEFQLYYQPKVNMVTGTVFGVEALIRWIHPEKGLIPPLDFLPFIDDTPLEIKVGEWVIKEALQQLDEWRKQDIQLEVSINISSNHLLSPSFVQVLEDSLAKYSSVNAKYLQLEILESSSLGDLDKITLVIETCKKLFGVTFSLDDFGTGYSSLTHLRSLPVDTIKIDQSFVKDMLDDPSDYSIIDGVISLTKAFDRSVIAEGVETINHGLMLLLMGCEQAQGYAIAKPMPADIVSQWLRDYIPNKNWSDCGSGSRNYQENSLAIFKLISEHWQETIRRKVLSEPAEEQSWPIIDSKACYCGHWIDQKKQDQLFKKEDILRLENAHTTIHLISRNIQNRYQSGDILTARTDMVDLEIAFDAMNTAINEL